MTTPFGTPLLIANPSAGRGRDAVLVRLRAALSALDIASDVAVTAGPGDAGRLARDAVTQGGYRMVVAVGGDGTVHEIVNGLVDAESGQPAADGIAFGAVAGGSGCDFIRTFGLDRAPEQAARHLAGETLYPIDLGRVRYLNERGNEVVRVFANIAELGWGAEVTHRANRMPRWVGKSRYVFSALLAARTVHRTMTTVAVDHTEVTEPLTEVVVANGQFFGGNIKVAPRALPDDGRFNVQLWGIRSTDVIRMLPKTRHGEHLSDPRVREYQSATVRVDAEVPLLLEADGEVLGTTPATFDILPKVLSLKV